MSYVASKRVVSVTARKSERAPFVASDTFGPSDRNRFRENGTERVRTGTGPRLAFETDDDFDAYAARTETREVRTGGGSASAKLGEEDWNPLDPNATYVARGGLGIARTDAEMGRKRVRSTGPDAGVVSAERRRVAERYAREVITAPKFARAGRLKAIPMGYRDEVLAILTAA